MKLTRADATSSGILVVTLDSLYIETLRTRPAQNVILDRPTGERIRVVLILESVGKSEFKTDYGSRIDEPER
jgi:hypothetical protein